MNAKGLLRLLIETKLGSKRIDENVFEISILFFFSGDQKVSLSDLAIWCPTIDHAVR